MRPLAVLIAVLSALAVLLAGCAQNPTTGGSADGPSTAGSSVPAEQFPRDVEVNGATVHLESAPARIVILGPSLTETAFAVGAGRQVTAVDRLSTYPADAPRSKLDAFKPSAEAVAAHQPDLVLVSNDLDQVVAGLTALKIPVALLAAPTDLAAALDQFRLVGKLTGHTAAGEQLATDTRTAIDKAVASVKDTPGTGSLSYYWELDPTFYTVTSSTFIGSVLKQFSLSNIADKAPKAAGGYPQLSAEFIIDADPDVIFLADTKCCKQTPRTVASRPGWDVTRAVKDTHGVVALDDDVASRWGPRIADLATQIAAALTKLQG